MRLSELLCSTPQGLYCPPADVFIDPLRPVARALVTHGHSDHARAGHGAVLATDATLKIMAERYGPGFAGATQAAAYGEEVRIGEVSFRFVPAGHVFGSAQIVVEHGGCRIVASGDYKRQADPTAAPFELVPCDVFISEATFGLPVFRHPPAEAEIGKLLASLRLFPERAHLVGAYALGKAQRVIALLRQAGYDRPIFIHGAMARLCRLYEAEGIDLGPLTPVAGQPKKALEGQIVVCPPSAITDVWSRRMGEPVTCFASGWMRVRARARQRGVELPLVISDHVDWDDLTDTVQATGCNELWVTHGQEDALVRWAELMGLKARPLHLVGYGEDEAEEGETVEDDHPRPERSGEPGPVDGEPVPGLGLAASPGNGPEG
jgi:putative mRNA 3-end processing factor